MLLVILLRLFGVFHVILLFLFCQIALLFSWSEPSVFPPLCIDVSAQCFPDISFIDKLLPSQEYNNKIPNAQIPNDRLFDSQVQHWKSGWCTAKKCSSPYCQTVALNHGTTPTFNTSLNAVTVFFVAPETGSKLWDCGCQSQDTQPLCVWTTSYRRTGRTSVTSPLFSLIENWIHATGGRKQRELAATTQREVPPWFIGDKLVTCPQEKAKVFNAHFCQQCSTSSPAAGCSFPVLSASAEVFFCH